jgi:two-component system chemotaxis response regulator CheY
MAGEGIVLVADDSRAIRAWLRRQLSENGYTVIEAEHGMDAVLAARTTRPDVVLLDVDMPKMNGYQALAAMRADERLKDVPVLFLTGRAAISDVVEGLRLGALDYLRKPCEPEELLARVQGALRMKARQDELHRRNAELSTAAATDPLTGLCNRRALEQRLPQVLEDARRLGQPAAVLVIDIDHFKQVNDREGHLAGDEALRAVAGRLRSGVRDDQTLGRWGGEEFLVLAPCTSQPGGLDLAERLRVAVGWEPVALSEQRAIPITVSIGVASGATDHLQLLRQADAALYVAKTNGRNRVVGSPLA